MSSYAKIPRVRFAVAHLSWCAKRNHTRSSAPGWSGLVAIGSALAPRDFGTVVVIESGGGTMVACVPYYCAAA